jgi:hypothetical protein
MKDIIINLFGTYTPDIITIYEETPEGLQIAKEVVIPDYPYIFGILLFSLTLYCVFRIVGGMIGGFRK